MAVEVDLPKKDLGHTFHDVVYQSRNPEADLHGNEPTSKKAMFILKHKHTDWAYEEEVRIIQEDEYYPIIKPARIIVGHRFNTGRLPDLRHACEENNVLLKRTRLEDEGVFID